MRIPLVLIFVAILAAACGPKPDLKETVTPADPTTVDTVLTGLLERLTTEYAEHGAEFVKRVPDIKAEVVVANGFVDWKDFKARVRLLDAKRDLWISKQITSRLKDLLATPREEPEKPAEEKDPETE